MEKEDEEERKKERSSIAGWLKLNAHGELGKPNPHEFGAIKLSFVTNQREMALIICGTAD